MLGDFNTLEIGGVHLLLDNVIVSCNTPEPATLALLTIDGVMISRQRRPTT